VEEYPHTAVPPLHPVPHPSGKRCKDRGLNKIQRLKSRLQTQNPPSRVEISSLSAKADIAFVGAVLTASQILDLI
jgi:hypothetical protein